MMQIIHQMHHRASAPGAAASHRLGVSLQWRCDHG
jgi:hypothetical protein